MRTHLWKGSTPFRPTDRGKQKGGGFAIFLTTGGVLAYLQSKSGFIAQTLNFMLLDSGHIICPGNLPM